MSVLLQTIVICIIPWPPLCKIIEKVPNKFLIADIVMCYVFLAIAVQKNVSLTARAIWICFVFSGTLPFYQKVLLGALGGDVQ